MFHILTPNCLSNCFRATEASLQPSSHFSWCWINFYMMLELSFKLRDRQNIMLKQVSLIKEHCHVSADLQCLKCHHHLSVFKSKKVKQIENDQVSYKAAHQSFQTQVSQFYRKTWIVCFWILDQVDMLYIPYMIKCWQNMVNNMCTSISN